MTKLLKGLVMFIVIIISFHFYTFWKSTSMLLLELEEGQTKWIITWNSNTHGFVLRGAAFIELFSIYYASTSEP